MVSPPVMSILAFVAVPLCAVSLAACNSKSKSDAAATVSASPTASTASQKTSAAPQQTAAQREKAPVFNVPVGPSFAVEPGVGIGPIRFGATVETIQRHMEAPCTEKTETSCRYSILAVDFKLKDGVLEEIRLQGDERVFDKDQPEHTYGIFNGRLRGDVELGMYREYVESVMGPPLSSKDVEPVEPPEGYRTVAIAEYPGATFEYDKLNNGNVVLAGIVLRKADVSAKPKSTARPPRPKPPLH